MRRELRVRVRIPRSSAQLALVAALLAWPGTVLCPVQQTMSTVGYVADESKPGAAVTLVSNQTTVLGSGNNGVVTMVPQNCFPAQQATVYGCSDVSAGFNPGSCGSGPSSSALFMPTSGGGQYNWNTIGTPSCYNPNTANNSTNANPLRRVYIPYKAKPVGTSVVRGDPDIFRFEGDIRVNKLCFWGASGSPSCSTYWPLEFSACSVSGSCGATLPCTTGGSVCATSGTRGSIQTINYDWTIPGSTVPVPMPTTITDGTIFNPWTFKFGIVGLYSTSCGATPTTAIDVTPGANCFASTNPSGVGCPIPLHLAAGKVDTPPADDDTNRLRRNLTVNTGNGNANLTVNCYITYPVAQPSQTVGHCTITISVQNNAQSCAKYRFLPSATCTERFPTTDPNYAPCPAITISG